MKYRSGAHFVWCSEIYDPTTASANSAAASIAPSSSPKGIYDALYGDVHREDAHSALIKGYKKTFGRLTKAWLSNGDISKDQHDEIISIIRSNSWRIWRPLLYVIPKGSIENAGRIKQIQRRDRAGYGPELQISDLQRHEFDIIEPKP